MLCENHILLFFVLACSALCEGFVRFVVLNDTQETQWKANDRCTALGYDGMAVIDTPEKWEFAKIALSNLPTDRKAWLGLEYDTGASAPRWLGGKQYSWGAWAPGQPVWSNTGVLALHDGGDWVWQPAGVNYPHDILCSFEFNNMGMTKHPNPNVDLTSLTPELTKTATSSEDCAMMCVSVASCIYLTYDASSDDCKMYGAGVASLLATDRGSPNAFNLYTIRAQ